MKVIKQLRNKDIKEYINKQTKHIEERKERLNKYLRSVIYKDWSTKVTIKKFSYIYKAVTIHLIIKIKKSSTIFFRASTNLIGIQIRKSKWKNIE